jgi:uncharacterized protein
VSPTPLHIPLFPLGTVLFPGGLLPLQVFEVRYLDMVKRCQRDSTPFGVVCLTQGSEVQRPDTSESFETVGSLAHLVQVDQPQPGLLHILCQGGPRFRIQNSEKLKHGLWLADVEILADDAPTPVPAELRDIPQGLHRLRERLQQDHPLIGQFLQAWPAYGVEAPSTWQDAGWVANRWAELLPLPNDTKQRLMTLDSPLLRLELVGDEMERLGI